MKLVRPLSIVQGAFCTSLPLQDQRLVAIFSAAAELPTGLKARSAEQSLVP
jgi:hypothetical protein